MSTCFLHEISALSALANDQRPDSPGAPPRPWQVWEEGLTAKHSHSLVLFHVLTNCCSMRRIQEGSIVSGRVLMQSQRHPFFTGAKSITCTSCCSRGLSLEERMTCEDVLAARGRGIMLTSSGKEVPNEQSMHCLVAACGPGVEDVDRRSKSTTMRSPDKLRLVRRINKDR
jgi:hypothetical protein